MSFAKRLLEKQNEQYGVAIGIALKGGVLRQCEMHEILMEGGKDIENAYRLGNARFTAGELSNVFENRLEMTDAIKKAVQENNSDECYACAKNAAE